MVAVFPNISKLNVVILVLLVFVGQVSVATAIPCQMDTSEQSTMMDHSAHMMGQPSTDSNVESMDDCCAKGGNCSMSGCISLAISASFNSMESHLASEKVISHIGFVPNQPSNSLYRPPILS